ncbi:hypothetical protein EYF80_040091 [Liparis tanakae]|uniref:Uncharacterized protein n=1 Tax=Liparis tanakae TaxID=230148 RepID=A0A4Z2G948_9TELE|nr:hypothetical protein EYF80_040091 [Liparis tanakae]
MTWHNVKEKVRRGPGGCSSRGENVMQATDGFLFKFRKRDAETSQVSLWRKCHKVSCKFFSKKFLRVLRLWKPLIESAKYTQYH